LSLTFNVVEGKKQAAVAPQLLASKRPVPEDLYAALARFVWEYPQLAPFIDALPEGGGEESIVAIREFSDLIAGAALTWPDWVAPEPSKGGLADAGPDTDLEVWSFVIQDVEDSVDLQVEGTWSRDQGSPPWPLIDGYTRVSEDGNIAVYRPDGGTRLTTLKMSWDELYVLDYQNVRPSAYIERNVNLAPPPRQTNPKFVYRTETVTWPTPVVPLVSVGRSIELPSGASLEAAIEEMLRELSTAPAGSRTNGTAEVLAIETSIDYRYLVMAHKDSEAFSLLPVFLVKTGVDPDDVETRAREIAKNLATWRDTTDAQSASASLRFLLTVFSTTIVSQDDPLPLVQFPGLVIPVPDDDPDWWKPTNGE
jgi:hypothetical protein